MSIDTSAPNRPPPGAPAPPPGGTADHRPKRRSWLLAAIILGIVMAAVTVWWATASAVDEIETIRPASAVTAAEIVLDAGTISLATGEQLHIDVERRSDRFASTPSVTSAVTDGVLQVTGTCPPLGIGHCATSVTITLPPTVAIDITTGAGSIDGTLTHGPVKATTEAGSITLTITEDITDLAVTTGAGTIDLVAPDVVYNVTAHTDVGRTSIDVQTAADAPRTIDARSDAGSITVRTNTAS